MNGAFIRRLTTVLAITVVMLGLFSTTAMADELYARVRGTVTDASGAVVTGATLKITNPAIGLTKQTTSDSDGSFEMINLPPGAYTLTASKTGFATVTVSGLTLQANQVYVSTISMKVGGITEEITVTANAMQVERTSMQLGGTITADDLANSPILNRNWISLQQTLPGVYSSDRFANNFATNGSQSQQNSYLINGTDAGDIALNTPLVLPSPDSIAEVRMITNTINPEYGRNSGAVMNAISKSGTNSFHGSAFESFRDTSLNVHDFFHLHPTVFHQNIFGGTIGGRIIKDKTFFFYSFQATRARQPSTESTSLGTAAGSTTVFNPATLAYGGAGNAPLSAFASLPHGAADLSTNPTPFPVTGSNGTVYPAGTPWSTVFAGGTVPTADYTPLSLGLVKQFVPQPNFSGNLFTFNPFVQVKTNQHIGRFDQNFGSKDALWFYAFASNNSSVDDLPFIGATLPGFGQTATSAIKNFSAAWNHTINTNMLNELRVGYTRLNFSTVFPQKVVQPSAVGFPGIFPDTSSAASYPVIAITGYFALGFSDDGPQPRKDENRQVTDNFSWVKGRHALKFGYEGRRFDVNNPFSFENNGHFDFGGSGKYSTGDGGLDFLLGIPDDYSQASTNLIIARAWEHYFYAQDQWRVKENLTLTIGTGYQIDQPINELQNKGLARNCFALGVVSKVFPTAPAGLLYPGDPGCNSQGGAVTKYTHFGPRVGFAWSPNWGGLTGGPGKTSIRGGFGIYYNRSEEEQNLQDLGAPPFGLTSAGVSDAPVHGSPSFTNPWSDIAGNGAIASKFPYTAPAPGAAVNFTFFEPLAGSVNINDPNRTVPYAMNYNLTIQRELPSQTILTVGYVGAQARKLVVTRQLNPGTPQGIANCLTNVGAYAGCKSDFLFTTVDFPQMFLLPGDIWGHPGVLYNGGSSNFNSLQVTVEKRMTHGLQFRSTYAWAHSLDFGSSYEGSAANGTISLYGDLARNYGDSDFDARHRFVTSVVYELPNLNKTFSALPSRLFGGWSISSINTIQTGFPVSFSDTADHSLACSLVFAHYGCGDRPDVLSPPLLLDPHNASLTSAGVPCTSGTSGCRTFLFFAPNTFAHNAVGTQGNVRRGFIHGPSFWNMDSSLRKRTKITEGTSLELSASAFNFLNHTNFARPSGNRNSSNFGRSTSITGNPRLIQLDARLTF